MRLTGTTTRRQSAEAQQQEPGTVPGPGPGLGMGLRLGTNLDVAGKMTIDLIFQGRKRNVNGKGTARRERRAGSKGQDTKANNKNKVRRNKKREKTETQEKYITKIEEARQQIVQQTKGAKDEGERGVAHREERERERRSQ